MKWLNYFSFLLLFVVCGSGCTIRSSKTSPSLTTIIPSPVPIQTTDANSVHYRQTATSDNFTSPPIVTSTLVFFDCMNEQAQITPVSQRDIDLHVDLNKNIYSIHSPITATISIINLKKEGLLINKRILLNRLTPEPLGEIAFLITNPSHNFVPFKVFVDGDFPNMYDFINLTPGGIITGTYTLTDYFRPIEDVGKYCVQAIYHNHTDPITFCRPKIYPCDTVRGLVAWKGEVYSNIVEFHLQP